MCPTLGASIGRLLESLGLGANPATPQSPSPAAASSGGTNDSPPTSLSFSLGEPHDRVVLRGVVRCSACLCPASLRSYGPQPKAVRMQR